MATGVLQKGDTFADGQVVNAARLNNLVDLGDVLQALISNKTAPPSGPNPASDYLLYLETGSGTLRKVLISALPLGVSSVGLQMPTTEFNVTGSPVTGSGTLAATWDNQPVNTVLAAPNTGSGAPNFRSLSPKDLRQPVINIAASTIDWSLGEAFWKVLPASTTNFNFTNMPPDGPSSPTGSQSIKVILTGVTGSVINWPTVFWPGGVHPVQSHPGTDLYCFHKINAAVIGVAYQLLS